MIAKILKLLTGCYDHVKIWGSRGISFLGRWFDLLSLIKFLVFVDLILLFIAVYLIVIMSINIYSGWSR